MFDLPEVQFGMVDRLQYTQVVEFEARDVLPRNGLGLGKEMKAFRPSVRASIPNGSKSWITFCDARSPSSPPNTVPSPDWNSSS